MVNHKIHADLYVCVFPRAVRREVPLSVCGGEVVGVGGCVCVGDVCVCVCVCHFIQTKRGTLLLHVYLFCLAYVLGD